MVHHAVQHLGGGDDIFAAVVDALNNHLLDDRHVLQRDLNAHVAAGNHDAVRDAQDLVDVVDALGVFNLGDDLDGVAAVFLQNFPDLQDVLRAAGEGGGDEIKARLDAKLDVVAVLVA